MRPASCSPARLPCHRRAARPRGDAPALRTAPVRMMGLATLGAAVVPGLVLADGAEANRPVCGEIPRPRTREYHDRPVMRRPMRRSYLRLSRRHDSPEASPRPPAGPVTRPPPPAAAADATGAWTRARAALHAAVLRTRRRRPSAAAARRRRRRRSPAGWRSLESLPTLREPEAVGAWLVTAARRQALRTRGARCSATCSWRWCRTRTTTGTIPPRRRPSPAARARELTAAVQRLPTRQRRLLEALADVARAELRGGAGRLGVPRGSIGPTRARGLDRLRRDTRLQAAVAA